jgi:Fe2+ or Zn2+ uptake regulation protein
VNIVLSREQQQAIDQSPEHLLRLTDPRTSVAYVLMPADQYESVRDVLEDERLQQTVRRVALRNAAARARIARG